MIPAPVGHQCPECVADARREYRRGPGRQIAVANVRSTPVTMVILGAIGIGYLWELVVAGGPGSLGSGPSPIDLFNAGAMYPPAIAAGQSWRVVSSIFLHAGLIHLALNSYVLWIFGNAIEREVGRLATLGVFLATGIFAGAASYAFSSGRSVGVGASGAIFGLVGAFVAYNYTRRHHVLAQARLRAAMTMLLINLIIGFSIPVIDWRAHLGGLVAGLVAGFAVDPGRPAAARRAFAIGGLALIVIGAAALITFRTAQITQDPSLIGG
jgi:membrane associated rhomboid family serine protease